MQSKYLAMRLRTVIITFLLLTGWYHAGLAQSQPVAPTAKSSVPQTDRSEYPEAPRWACNSFNLLADVGLIEPQPIYGSGKRATRYELAVDLARLLDYIEHSKMPPLTRTNTYFYIRDEHGIWLPRYTRADMKANVLKLREEFAPELKRIGSRVDKLTENQALDKYFADPPPAVPKVLEARIIKAEFLPNSSPVRGKVTIDLAADIALPTGCQLTVLPTWSWQIVSVQWRGTAHDEWDTKPPYTATLISPQASPIAQYECMLPQSYGQWLFKVQATAHYQTTTCGNGTAVAVGYILGKFP